MTRVTILLWLTFVCTTLFAQTTNLVAPGAPGGDAHWPTAAKNGFGAANTLDSKVWFTLANGVMTEVFYPTLDVPNSQILEFIVCRESRCWMESTETTHTIKVEDARSLSFEQTNASDAGEFSITKNYTTDPERATVLINVALNANPAAAYRLFLLFDPSLKNSGLHDSAWQESDALLASEGDISTALLSSEGFAETSSGFHGTSDGVAQLRQQGKLGQKYRRAENGNVVQLASLNAAKRFTIALAFGRDPREAIANARASLAKGFDRAEREYQQTWNSYLAPLKKVAPAYERQYYMSAMVLKALEDKTYRGAMIASPSNPWGAGANANEANTTGYHAVWARDLYHVATAFHAMGDSDSANRALDYLFQVQQKADGSFPQNSHVDGKAIGGALQLDQVGLPLVLASQLGRTDKNTWQKHIKPAADFIVRNGPRTEQERWEEESGYSPSTMAAAIAGLVCAARIAALNGDAVSARAYREQADDWVLRIEQWTATSSGALSQPDYFLRINQNGDPNDGAKLEINSNGGVYDEREIVDAGFLELVRLGISAPNDPLIKRSLEIVDRTIKAETPNGSAWYRYNHDAYGERADGGAYDGRNGKGRPWPLLTGERGEYELAGGNKSAARGRLNSLLGFANDGLMLPEQIWDQPTNPRTQLKFGEGTGSATPLAWSMAQFIRLAVNLSVGRNLETPLEVQTRYRQPRGSKVLKGRRIR